MKLKQGPQTLFSICVMIRYDIKNALERFKEKAGNLPTKLVIKSHESGNNSNTEIPENYTEYTVEYKIASTNQ